MLARVGLVVRWAVLAAGAGLAITGCGGGEGPRGPGRIAAGGTVDIYSSLPMQGPAAARADLVARGIKLALSQAGDRAGPWAVRYVPLDDSTSAAGGWSPLRTSSNASRVIADPRAVVYLGELDSAASRISVPILNQGSVAQISPGSPYVGLTTAAPGSARGEPGELYPTGQRTFMRLVPSDAVQAQADLTALRQGSCANALELDDRGDQGSGLSVQVMLARTAQGVAISRGPTLRGRASRAFANDLKRRRPDCVLLSGGPSPAGVRLARAVRAALPNVRIFAGEAFCTGSFVTAIGPAAARSFACLAPVPDLAATGPGRRFLAAYRAAYRGADPDPYVAYGYEAMRLTLERIASLGVNGNSKSAVLAALQATAGRQSVLGTYSFDANGDTTLRSYGLYRPGSDGELTYERTVTAQPSAARSAPSSSG